MNKEKYKILVDTYFNKEEHRFYPKNSIVELTEEKARNLLKMKCIEKVKEKPKDDNNKQKDGDKNGRSKKTRET